MQRLPVMPLVAVLLAAAPIAAQDDAKPKTEPAKTPTARELVTAAAADYVDGLYEAKPERIERSVHADLVKYGFWRRDAEQPYQGTAMTYERLVALAGTWNADGKQKLDGAPRKIEVLRLLPEIALVKLTAKWGIDYMQLQNVDGAWTIRHIAWQSHPGEPGAAFDVPPEQTKQLERAGLDYVEAFYEAKPELIERSVHPQLAKYGFYRPDGAPASRAMPMTFDQLKGLAATLHADQPPAADAPKRVEVVDALDQIACLEIEGHWGIDYVHAIRGKDGVWKLAHVLWQSPPPPAAAASDGGQVEAVAAPRRR